jgi:hypothetical protein
MVVTTRLILSAVLRTTEYLHNFCAMTLVRILQSLAALGSVNALQLPLLVQEQTPLAGHSPASRPLVDTEALQAAIKSENLLSRAKELYEIAKLGEPEYNHPTRVIGSEGTCCAVMKVNHLSC